MHRRRFLFQDKGYADGLIDIVFYNLLGKDILSQCTIRRINKTKNYILIESHDPSHNLYLELLRERRDKFKIYIEEYKPIWSYITRRESIRLE